MIQIKVGRVEDALLISEELEGRLDDLTLNERVMFTWRARYVQALALQLKQRQQVAMDVFCSAYAVFLPDNETMMYEMPTTRARFDRKRCPRSLILSIFSCPGGNPMRWNLLLLPYDSVPARWFVRLWRFLKWRGILTSVLSFSEMYENIKMH